MSTYCLYSQYCESKNIEYDIHYIDTQLNKSTTHKINSYPLQTTPKRTIPTHTHTPHIHLTNKQTQKHTLYSSPRQDPLQGTQNRHSCQLPLVCHRAQTRSSFSTAPASNWPLWARQQSARALPRRPKRRGHGHSSVGSFSWSLCSLIKHYVEFYILWKAIVLWISIKNFLIIIHKTVKKLMTFLVNC